MQVEVKYSFLHKPLLSKRRVAFSYRYTYNGKETDSETKWQDYGMRMYNPFLARFFSVDPITRKYPELTPYQFASNSPIMYIDIDGLEGTTLSSPVGNAPITSNYKDTRTCKNCSAVHAGIDYGVATGSDVQVTAPGTVVRSYYSKTYGNAIIIDHGPTPNSTTGEHTYTVYAHNSERTVSEGETVSTGDIIAKSGNTGKSTGPHLHYEVIVTSHDPTTSKFYEDIYSQNPGNLELLIPTTNNQTNSTKGSVLSKSELKSLKTYQNLSNYWKGRVQQVSKEIQEGKTLWETITGDNSRIDRLTEKLKDIKAQQAIVDSKITEIKKKSKTSKNIPVAK